ncbi:Dyp-type peroxidase [Elizabethkingia anophelis]|nr:Dyp-type peroxidase [Elizabethkingia anophelis]MCT4101036.1 Dyp-type peroxidase [Elizabethkingia anophelis]MCT4165703.1 Dyp-type peroxidase [Elizabethkingia anophelis]MDV3593072.1 peroxidase [Elizabethkingia anophelis]HAY3539018.1 Dyp-type peroxidase [Elizabethkingia anophelis]
MAVQSQKVTDNPNANTYFMVWNFKDTDNIKEAFQRVCALVSNLNNSAAVRFPNVRVSCVMGIGYNAWKKLELQEPLPKELDIFKEVKGEKHTAVSTPGDLHFHIRADQFSICFDMATAISDVLSPVASCIEEIHGFRYWDGRAILGFVDGTENPQGSDRDFFAKVGTEDEAYEGGSYLFVQKYIHDMKAWNSLPVPEQEKVIGRYKASDIEMTDDVKPANSHSALANVGDDFKVVRDNMPFRTSSETGTYFIAYASTFSTVQKMLESIFVGDPAGNYDRILDFSTAKTGSLFFVPTMDMLGDFSG